MSAYDYYNGLQTKAARKSWWNPFSWWPSDDPEPAPEAEVHDPDFWEQPVVRELVREIENTNRLIEVANDASERRRLRRERAILLERVQALEVLHMKIRSRDGRSAG